MALEIGGGISIGGGVSVGAESGGGGGGFVSGNMTVGNGGFGNSEYGWNQPESYGSVTFADFPTGPTYRIYYEPAPTPLTIISFFDGTYGATVVDGTLGTIDGETSVTVTIDGVTEIGTLIANTSSCKLEFAGDVFSLQSKNGQTLAVNMDAGSAPAALVSGTITVGAWPIDNYGFDTNFAAGSISIAQTGLILGIGYSIYGGGIVFNVNGTYGNVIVTYGQINGSNTITLTIDGITKQITFNGMSWADNADTFGLTTKLGQTLNLSMVVP